MKTALTALVIVLVASTAARAPGFTIDQNSRVCMNNTAFGHRMGCKPIPRLDCSVHSKPEPVTGTYRAVPVVY